MLRCEAHQNVLLGVYYLEHFQVCGNLTNSNYNLVYCVRMEAEFAETDVLEQRAPVGLKSTERGKAFAVSRGTRAAPDSF